MKNIAILVMITKENPSFRNACAMVDTFCTKTQKNMEYGIYKNKYDFYFYYADESLTTNAQETDELFEHKVECVHAIAIKEAESIYRTYEKTLKCLQYILDLNNEYDWVVRINGSAFLNMDLLDTCISKDWFKDDEIYCNVINSIITGSIDDLNTLYPRGDFYMMSGKVAKDILPIMEKYENCDSWTKDRIEVTHVDDVISGLVFKKYFGDEYWKHYNPLKYIFMPEYEDFRIDPMQITHSICSRVKTIPPDETYSGYSWDDNEYRKIDVEKIKYLDKVCDTIIYDWYSQIGTDTDFVVDKFYNRPTYFCNLIPIQYKGMLDLMK